MTHPDDLAADVAEFNRVLPGEIDGYTLDKRWIRKNGRVIDGILAAKCMRGADVSVDYFVGLVLDNSERKRAEEALRASEQNYAHCSSRLTKARSKSSHSAPEIRRRHVQHRT
jgi:PAS domain-containing protein